MNSTNAPQISAFAVPDLAVGDVVTAAHRVGNAPVDILRVVGVPATPTGEYVCEYVTTARKGSTTRRYRHELGAKV